MFKQLIATSIFTALLTFPLTTKAEKHPLIGVNLPLLTEEVEERGGWSMEPPYYVQQVLMDGQELLLLNRLIRDSQGKPFLQVVNVLLLPPMAETEKMAGGASCLVNGQPDHNWIFVVKSANYAPFFTKASQAWRVEGEKFKEVNVQGLRFKCEKLASGL